MKFNVRLTESYNNSIEERLIKNGIEIRHVDLVLKDLVIVETREISKLKKFSFIRSIKETRTGTLLDVPNHKHKPIMKAIPEPTLDLQPLRDVGLYGMGSKIAVIDSGYYTEVKEAINFSEHPNSYDTTGHGSIVITLIKQILPGAEIYSAKVCNEDDKIDEENVFKALDWVTTLPDVKCINLSLGMDAGCNGDCDLAEKINVMSEMGYIIVAAMGNKASKTHCPACAENSIAVGALDQTGNRVASFSSTGHINSNKPDLVASGHGTTSIYGTPPEPYHGTSFAAPIVTGILGATYHMFKTGKRVKEYLINGCESLIDEPRTKQGYGKVNLPKYLEGLKDEEKDEG